MVKVIYFGEYLKDYLEVSNISQTEFATKMGVTKKHINEILNGKKSITLEMAANIERLTGISSQFIVNIENGRIIEEYLNSMFKDESEIMKYAKTDFHIKELEKSNWLTFKDRTNAYQVCIDLMNFLKIKDFSVLEEMKSKVLFKKTGEDFNKLTLWIARCEELCTQQDAAEYAPSNFTLLIEELKALSYEEGFSVEKVGKLLNKYGIFFVVEKALPSSKVRGAMKIRGNKPAIFLTKNYVAKDSFYFELFHELGHCKSDYNVGKNKVIIDGDEEQERKADIFALTTMVSEQAQKEILLSKTEKELLSISKKHKISMSFIVGKLAKTGRLKYSSNMYNKYKNI
ncbi:MAG: helix-turn-helix domain-containing protein [Clostridia bacterium]